jgi:hypothetical protein
MLYSTLLFLSFCMDFGIAETGIARGSPPGTTTEVLRFGISFAEIRVVSIVLLLRFQLSGTWKDIFTPESSFTLWLYIPMKQWQMNIITT